MALIHSSGYIVPGLSHVDGEHDVFLHNGRQLCNAAGIVGSVVEHGFCLVTGSPTNIPMDGFREHFVHKKLQNTTHVFTFDGTAAVLKEDHVQHQNSESFGLAGLVESAKVVAQYQWELANMLKRAFPQAELVVAYNHVLRASPATKLADSPAPEAPAIAQKIVDMWMFVNSYKTGYLKKVKKMLLEDNDEAAFLDMVVRNNSKKSSENPQAAMPGASPELQAAVRELLGSEQERDLIKMVRDLLRSGKRGVFRSADDGNENGTALNGMHTDITEYTAMLDLQFRMPNFLSRHAFKSQKYMVYHLNTWRNVNPAREIQDYHLAVLDRSSIAKEDLVQREFTFDGYKLQQYSVRHHSAQRWVYFPNMAMHEILLFTQGRCLLELGTAAAGAEPSGWQCRLADEECPWSIPHMAVRDPQAPEDAQRRSCESRFLIFVPVDEPGLSKL